MAPDGNNSGTVDEVDVDNYKGQKAAAPAPAASGIGQNNTIMTLILLIIAICSIIMVAELGSVVSSVGKEAEPASITINNGGSGSTTSSGTADVTVTDESGEVVVQDIPEEVAQPGFNFSVNPCDGKKPDMPNTACFNETIAAMTVVGPQSGANVTKGYKGGMEVDHVPILTPYWMNGMCPVNVHWHLGSEHLSVGEYDETGVGPTEIVEVDGGADYGFRCKLFDASDAKFTTPYEWKHCVAMVVGETYEVHWPHSAAGACGTPWQYQTPFYDGVFCMDGVLTETHSQIGVQAQVYTIVNDEDYYYPDLIRGMIVDGDMGADIAKYTGSTTGSSRNNELCSAYSPITWQVDRKCHLISASSFDKLCADMKAQSDDMSKDLEAHGSRDLVITALVADNQNDRRTLRASA